MARNDKKQPDPPQALDCCVGNYLAGLALRYQYTLFSISAIYIPEDTRGTHKIRPKLRVTPWLFFSMR
jgi:hypothetical protein